MILLFMGNKITQYKYIREIDIKYKKKRIKNNSPINEQVCSPKHIIELFSDLQNEAKEKLITISLDAKLKILCFELVAIGSVHSIALRPVEAIRAAIPLNPTGIILVHNHTTGDPTPSEEDEKFTARLLIATTALGIFLHDHIIIGSAGEYYSFNESGLIKKLEVKYKNLFLEL